MKVQHYRGGVTRTKLGEASRHLRRELTQAEAKLWRSLRHRQLGGWKFRRQHEFGPYILDFYCADQHLAVEADGSQHFEAEQMAYDAARTEYLAAHGVRVLRFTNLEILQRTEPVLECIL